MSPLSSPAPAPAPAPKSNKSLSIKSLLSDIKVVLGTLVTIGEGVLVALPAGEVRTGFQIALPILVALAASLSKVIS